MYHLSTAFAVWALEIFSWIDCMREDTKRSNKSTFWTYNHSYVATTRCRPFSTQINYKICGQSVRCGLVECRCFRFSILNSFYLFRILSWFNAGFTFAVAQHSLWSCVECYCYCHSQLNTMYGSYLKFLKTHQMAKEKDQNEQEILINCFASSIQQAHWLSYCDKHLSFRVNETRCLARGASLKLN